jgi:ComF family protein
VRIALFDTVFEWLVPRGCSACDDPRAGPYYCAACAAGGDDRMLEHAGIDGVPVLPARRYEAPLSTAIRRFKYGGRPDLARPLAALASASLVAIDAPERSLFVPVPLHPRRLAERGYNQSALLARELARSVGGECRCRALERSRYTEQQAGRSRSDRATNVAAAFLARAPEPLRGARVVLVDDVVTTGATALACLAALRAAGAEPVGIVTLALGRSGRDGDRDDRGGTLTAVGGLGLGLGAP